MLQGSNTCGGGKSDPVMTGFTGRSFNFFGDVGKTYSLVSSMNHQLSARLKLAQMWNHNGTNMDGIGFMYRNYRVLMELTGDTPHGTPLPCPVLPCLTLSSPVLTACLCLKSC